MRSFFSQLSLNDTNGDPDEYDLYCKPDSNWSFNETCNYIKDTDACQGGGYLEWATFVYCCEDPVAKWFIVCGGVLFLVLLFLMLSTSADDFFSVNVSTIVAHLNISENVAGVTFMAFGNGAPDIFASIASVLSSPRPKADLALGALIGGAIFVTLAVTAAIVVTRPFKAAFWSTLRDLIFLLITASFTLSFFIFFDEIELWQPLTFLGIYVVYVVIVFTTEYFKKKKKKLKTREQSKRNSIIPDIKLNAVEDDGVKESMRVDDTSRRGSAIRRLSVAVSTVLGTGHNNEMFIEDPENDTDDFLVMHNKVYHGEDLRSRAETMHNQSISVSNGIFYDLLYYFAPQFDDEDPSIFERIKTYLLWPIMTIFKLTIPLAESRWSKPMAIIHSILAPQCILFNTQFLLFVPIEGGPGLYAYVPIISILLIIFILCTTSMDQEPRFYKMTYSLAGFVMSVAWIYCISSEVVDVVDMLGIVSGINQAVLGLTIIAWANSVGDLVADISVAKQGFPRMAMAASIGGPLFNQLIGFGLPFTIAKLKGDTVPISLDGVNVVMITFLFISILFTTLNLLIFRAYLKRLYGLLLIVIYISFLVFVVLSETGILVWM
ncbi:hypothetical protein PENTCL1PPCAC_11499 [Pristionchus entomophagus]|uniref:Sodium/calcium exchanger membrane region domain-containing protein n=1 Tax=Pristionchus entomophagus TaxID=358040 RepID=A0AAV5T6M9_9BILA|nr:hypothetical protein PENTCL1PPCAC_11499 [Pristionchus entomophagus]